MVNYCFSKAGASHIAANMPCQDHSAIFQIGSWWLAVVADGVGTCEHADVASQLAVGTAVKVVRAAFPYTGRSEDMQSLLRIAMYSAANAIERHAIMQSDSWHDYHTTLTMVLYDGETLYYVHAGDSGILALDQDGLFHVVTSKHNNEFGEVYPLAARNFDVGAFEVGKTGENKKIAAVLLATDGLLDWLAPRSLAEYQYPIHVPRTGLFVNPDFWKDAAYEDEDDTTAMQAFKKTMLEQLDALVQQCANAQDTEHAEYGSLREGNLRDDLTLALLLNPQLEMDAIAWEAPPAPTVVETYLNEFKRLLSLYPENAKQSMKDFIQRNNPTWGAEKVAHFFDSLLAKAKKTVGEDKEKADAGEADCAEEKGAEASATEKDCTEKDCTEEGCTAEDDITDKCEEKR